MCDNSMALPISTHPEVYAFGLFETFWDQEFNVWMNFDAEPAPGDMAGKAVGTLSNLEMVGERWRRYDPNISKYWW